MGSCCSHIPGTLVQDMIPISEGMLKWNARSPLASGGDKRIFHASFDDRPVVVCCAADAKDHQKLRRFQHEIDTLKKLGEHPSIIRMLDHGRRWGSPYFVLELAQWDLGRLRKECQDMRIQMPSTLCARLFRQLVSGLQHMHDHDVLHMDLKDLNVLATSDCDAKLCDFGIATRIGARRPLVAAYVAPEVCNGASLGPEVDSWGLGLILHQLYQHEHALLDLTRRPFKLRRDMPCTKHGMPEEVQQVIEGLIKDSPEERLTLRQLLESSWLSLGASEIAHPRALKISAQIGQQHSHLFGWSLEDAGLWQAPVDVLLVKQPDGTTTTTPGATTTLSKGSQIDFRVTRGDLVASLAAAARIETALSPDTHTGRSAPVTPGSDSDRTRSSSLSGHTRSSLVAALSPDSDSTWVM